MKATSPLRLYVLAVLCLPFAPLFCVMDVDVNIYAVGQGNGILVKGGNHAMLIDAGSSASRLTALFHNRAFRDGRLEGAKERYKIDNPKEQEKSLDNTEGNRETPPPAPSETSTAATPPTLSSALIQDTSSQTGESSSNATTPEAASTSPQTTPQERRKRPRNNMESPEESKSANSRPTKKARHKKEQVAYIEDLLRKIRSDLPDDPNDQSDAPRKYLQTIVVTHPDSDHYDLIPRLLEVQNRVKVDNIVLSGFYEDYENPRQNRFLTWLQQMQTEGLLTNAPLFTGTTRADGKQLDENGEPLEVYEQNYARAYHSYLSDTTEREQQIEEALQIFGGSTDPQNSNPFFEILSMNAGHDTAPVQPSEEDPPVSCINAESNVNSLVLRLSAPCLRNEQSEINRFVFCGDATERTWERIHKLFARRLKKDPRFLNTDYLLVSHHGSPHDGCTSKTMLKLLAPKICFVSAGRHKKCHHPGKEVIELLTGDESPLWQTKEHSMAYFGVHPTEAQKKKKKGHKKKPLCARRRDNITHALFSTFIHGDMHVPMHEDFQVAISYNKMPSVQAYQNDALQDFLCTLHGLPGVSFKIVEGKQATEAMQELEKEAQEDDEHIFVWCQALGQTGNVHPYLAEVQPNLDYIKREDFFDLPLQHFLYDAENKTFTQMCVDESNAVPMEIEE